jgi:tRNA 2-thiocytidine biosynthesis protein TtcA
VVPSHLMDRKLFPFAALEVTGEANEDGDKAFDEEPLESPPVTIEDANSAQGNARPRPLVIPIAATMP